jgi:hypothetical protein
VAVRDVSPAVFSVAAPDHVAVPAQDGVRSHDQTHASQRVAWQGREQGSQKRDLRVGSGPGGSELLLQHADLVAQREDLDVLVPMAHRQQSKDREGVAHREIGQAHQQERSSCRSWGLGTRGIDGFAHGEPNHPRLAWTPFPAPSGVCPDCSLCAPSGT